MERRLIARNLNKRMKKYGITQRETAVILGMGYSTFRRKLKHPEEFTVGELMAFCNYAGVGLKELLKY